MTARYALVPVVATPKMMKAGADAWLDCGSRLVLNKAGAAVTAGISASPGADLLERIVIVLRESEDRISSYAKAVSNEERGYAFRIRSILDELGGSNG
jgi:hypothetical protein